MKGFVFCIYMKGEFTPAREPAWEENIRVYYDESEEAAATRARNGATAAQCSYQTNDGYALRWIVHSVRLVNTLDVPIIEGEDIFFRFLKDEEARSLLTPFED